MFLYLKLFVIPQLKSGYGLPKSVLSLLSNFPSRFTSTIFNPPGTKMLDNDDVKPEAVICSCDTQTPSVLKP